MKIEKIEKIMKKYPKRKFTNDIVENYLKEFTARHLRRMEMRIAKKIRRIKRLGA